MEKVLIVFSFHPRFAFAETDSVDQIEKAKSAMEGVEIQGRKLRVRRLEKKTTYECAFTSNINFLAQKTLTKKEMKKETRRKERKEIERGRPESL